MSWSSRIAALGKGVPIRTKPEDIQQQCFIEPLPPILQESAFWFPPMSQGGSSILRPLPIRPVIERLGQRPELMLSRVRSVEVCSACHRSREQDRGVNCGKLRSPCTAACAGVQEVVVKTTVTRGIGFWPLPAVPEEAQRRERSRHSCMT